MLPGPLPSAIVWAEPNTACAMERSSPSMAEIVPATAIQYWGAVRVRRAVSPYAPAAVGARMARTNVAKIAPRATAPTCAALRGERIGLSLHPGAAAAARLIGRGRRSGGYALTKPVKPQVIAPLHTGVWLDGREDARGGGRSRLGRGPASRRGRGFRT